MMREGDRSVDEVAVAIASLGVRSPNEDADVGGGRGYVPVCCRQPRHPPPHSRGHGKAARSGPRKRDLHSPLRGERRTDSLSRPSVRVLLKRRDDHCYALVGDIVCELRRDSLVRDHVGEL